MADKALLEARLAAAQARLAAAKNAVSEDDIAARELRAQIQKAEAEAESEERTKLFDALTDRLEATKVAFPDRQFLPVMAQRYPDTFIVARNGKAHASWVAALARSTRASMQGKTAEDPSKITLQYAIDSLYDWNGATAFDTDPELSRKLRIYLTENPGLVSPITEAAGELAGVFADQRTKSD